MPRRLRHHHRPLADSVRYPPVWNRASQPYYPASPSPSKRNAPVLKLMFGPSAGPSPPTMPSADFCQLSRTSRCGLPSDRNVGRCLSSMRPARGLPPGFPAVPQYLNPIPVSSFSDRPPRVMHTQSRLCLLHIQPHLPCRYRTLNLFAFSSRCSCLRCSCPGTPSPAGPVGDSHPQVGAPCRAHKTKG